MMLSAKRVVLIGVVEIGEENIGAEWVVRL